MIIGHYNEYYLPNNDFLYQGDHSINRLRSKKSYKKFKQELVRKYGCETIEKQTILYYGVKTCVLAYVTYVNQAGALYFIEHLKNYGLQMTEYVPFTLDEIEELFKRGSCKIHIYGFGLVTLEGDLIELEANYLNNLHKFSLEKPTDFSSKSMIFKSGNHY